MMKKLTIGILLGFGSALSLAAYRAGTVVSTTSTSVDSEIALFSGTNGTVVKRATGTGVVTVASGVANIVAAGSTGRVLTSDGVNFVSKLPSTKVATITPTCTISRQDDMTGGNWLSSASNPSTGVCTFAMSGWAVKPYCVAAYNDGYQALIACNVRDSLTDATSIRIECFGSATGTAINGGFNIACSGYTQ